MGGGGQVPDVHKRDKDAIYGLVSGAVKKALSDAAIITSFQNILRLLHSSNY
jgi:hypothetical protein